MANELLNGTIIRRGQGTYNLKVVPGSGTAKLQYSVDNEAMQDIPDATSSATLTLPKCRLNAVITGDAKMYLTDIS
mgnify:CR=1 FL=1